VITYVNCTAELKALSDIVCTSSNAIQIVESLPIDQKIIFGPDKNLGAYVAKKTGRDLVLWNGACMVHEIFSREKITKLKERYPGAKLLAHPECEDVILEMADYIGSTTGILKYATNHPDKEFIVATEPGIIHQMQKDNPDKVFIPAPPNNDCACNDCPHMKRNTLEKLYLCLKNELPEIKVPQDIIKKAVVPIERMLEISARLGL
jgi:quinolinate synthase